MSGFIYKLQSILMNTTSDNSSNTQIARCLLKHIHLANNQITAKKLAEACYTSISSISRFAMNLGYSGFNEMKRDFIHMNAEYEELKLDSQYLVQHSFTKYKTTITNTIQAIPEIKLKHYCLELSEIIYHAPHIYLLATDLCSNIISPLHRAILATGTYVDFVVDKHEQIRLVKDAQKDETYIIISFDSVLPNNKDIMVPLMMSQATKVLISNDIHTKYASQFQVMMDMEVTDESFATKYALMVFVDYFIPTYLQYVKDNIPPDTPSS